MLISRLKIKIIVNKNLHTNTDNALTNKFYNRSIYSYFYTNGIKLDQPSVNLLCYAPVRQRSQTCM